MSDDADPDDRSGERDSESEAVRKKYDWSTVAPSTAVVETVSDVTDTDVLELRSLYDSVDPDAIDKLCRDELTAGSDTVSISFEFEELNVTVRSDGGLTVSPIGSD